MQSIAVGSYESEGVGVSWRLQQFAGPSTAALAMNLRETALRMTIVWGIGK